MVCPHSLSKQYFCGFGTVHPLDIRHRSSIYRQLCRSSLPNNTFGGFAMFPIAGAPFSRYPTGFSATHVWWTFGSFRWKLRPLFFFLLPFLCNVGSCILHLGGVFFTPCERASERASGPQKPRIASLRPLAVENAFFILLA